MGEGLVGEGLVGEGLRSKLIESLRDDVNRVAPIKKPYAGKCLTIRARFYNASDRFAIAYLVCPVLISSYFAA